ncbi:DUF2971 domain-containing protein [Vibrio sp. H11]|uniref:DUF2971 domain-containing protein n=1 Tax=Vibrio sp. H11 TaxID=2565928 RepID=UPI0010A62576|nr:DUF2971 domain-containing protein [Vibrio sp. H11]
MDTKAKRLFQQKKYSHLSRLDDKKLWDADLDNLALYYFVLDANAINKDKEFNEIVNRLGNESEAYLYLGGIAQNLFTLTDDIGQAEYFYRKSVEKNPDNLLALWSLFTYTRDARVFYDALTKSYKEDNIIIINDSISYREGWLVDANFSVQEWKKIKDIFEDHRFGNTASDILTLCYYYLGDYDKGLKILEKCEWPDLEILYLYRNKGLIDDQLILKKHFYQKNLNLNVTAQDVYENIKIKNSTSLKTKLKSAFEAEMYSDVVDIYEKLEEKDRNSTLKLYHIVSTILMGSQPDIRLVESVEKDGFNIAISKPSIQYQLYCAYLILKERDSLLKILEKSNQNLHHVEMYGIYKNIITRFGDKYFFDFCHYNKLKEMMDETRDIFNNAYNNQELTDLQERQDELSEIEIIRLASLLISKNCNLDVASELLEGINRSSTSINILGYIAEQRGDDEKAHKLYQEAFELMTNYGENNEVIMRSYLKSRLKVSGEKINNEHDKLIKKYNKTITNHFPYTFRLTEKDSLYKYYPFNEYTLDALMNSYFYMASETQLNDPIELPYDNLINGNDNQLLRPEFKLSSLSQNSNSMLMWSHYAQNHTGIMVEYVFSGDLPEGVGIDKVQYEHTLKRYNEKGLFLFNQYMLTKNDDWAYEKEVRLFGYNREKVYYEAYRYPNKITDKANAYIRSITLGYKFQESTIKLITTIISELNRNRHSFLPKIELKKSRISEGNFFELDYETIDYDI